MAEYNRLQGLVEEEIEAEMNYQRDRELRSPYDPEANNIINNPVFHQSLTREEIDDM